MSQRPINLLYLCNMRNILFIGPRSSHRLFQIYQFHAKVKETTKNIRVRELMEGQIFNSICRATQTDLGVSELKGKKVLQVRTCLVPYFSTLLKNITQDSLKLLSGCLR